jgi:hypothetical protein
MEISEALSAARLAVEEADLPTQWQERAFGEILRSLLGGQTTTPPRGVGRQTEEPASGTETALGRLAGRLGVAEGDLADVFSVEDETVSLYVASGKIPATKSKATREIGLLITAARQGAGIDESWTDVAHIRDALSQYNRYDQSNFSKYLRDMGDVFNLRGKPVQQVRLTRPGWEAASDLVQALTGSSS